MARGEKVDILENSKWGVIDERELSEIDKDRPISETQDPWLAGVGDPYNQ